MAIAGPPSSIHLRVGAFNEQFCLVLTMPAQAMFLRRSLCHSRKTLGDIYFCSLNRLAVLGFELCLMR